MHQVNHSSRVFAESRYKDIIGWVPDVRGKNGKINPHLTRFVDKHFNFIDVFSIKPVYYETLHGHWRPLSEICSYVGNHQIVMENWQAVHPRYINWLHKRMQLIGGKLLIPSFVPSVFMESVQYARMGHFGLTTTTVYPDPDTETTSVDGYIGFEGNDTWSNIVAATDGNVANDVSTDIIVYVNGRNTPKFWLYRGFFLFDTSAVGGDTISSADFDVYATGTLTGASGSALYLSLVNSSPASNTALTNADFDQVGSTKGASDINVSAVASSAYNTWSLNATGLTWVNGAGITKLALRHGQDITSEAPPQGGANVYNGLYVGTSADGPSNDPMLTVIHTASAATFIPKIIMF